MERRLHAAARHEQFFALGRDRLHRGHLPEILVDRDQQVSVRIDVNAARRDALALDVRVAGRIAGSGQNELPGASGSLGVPSRLLGLAFALASPPRSPGGLTLLGRHISAVGDRERAGHAAFVVLKEPSRPIIEVDFV